MPDQPQETRSAAPTGSQGSNTRTADTRSAGASSEIGTEALSSPGAPADTPAASLRYRTIVADPPWRYDTTGRKNSRGTSTCAAGFYETMTDRDIAALPVAEWVADNAHLYLWVTNTRLFECRPDKIAREWGFTYKTLLTWVKTGQPGLGSYFRSCTEHVAFCTRGSAVIPPALRERNHFTTLRTRHSAKPDSFYDLVERVSPAPRLEMFSRRARLGWDTWGDEALHGLSFIPRISDSY